MGHDTMLVNILVANCLKGDIFSKNNDIYNDNNDQISFEVRTISKAEPLRTDLLKR